MTDDQLHDLRDRASRLVKLLDEWEPGIFTWCDAVNQEWWNVVQWAPEAAKRRLSA